MTVGMHWFCESEIFLGSLVILVYVHKASRIWICMLAIGIIIIYLIIYNYLLQKDKVQETAPYFTTKLIPNLQGIDIIFIFA